MAKAAVASFERFVVQDLSLLRCDGNAHVYHNSDLHNVSGLPKQMGTTRLADGSATVDASGEQRHQHLQPRMEIPTDSGGDQLSKAAVMCGLAAKHVLRSEGAFWPYKTR